MSNTPRTDAVAFGPLVGSSLARELERENAALTSALRSCNEDLNKTVLVLTDAKARKTGLKLVAAYDALLERLKP